MENQRMSDSPLGFSVGQTTQVIQLSRLKCLTHLPFKIRQTGMPPTGHPMAKRVPQTIKRRNAELTIIAMPGSGICGLWNTSRVIMKLCGPGNCECTIDSFPSLKGGIEEIPQWKKQLAVGNEILYFSFPILSLSILSSLPRVQSGNSCKG